MSNYDMCLGCMSPKNAAQCPKCGYVDGTPRILPALEAGTVLNGRYLVGKRLSANGEGFTYIGFDQSRGQKVTIREYLPQTLCDRRSGSDDVIVRSGVELVYNDYLADFLEISKAVARLGESTAAVPVLDVFECNRTAYAVYRFVQGATLSDLVRRAKRLTWEEARPIFQPLIATMVSAHALGLVHFGISPDTILLTKDGRLALTGFGVPDARIAETDLRAEMYDGFSAIEQYALEGKKGKWTDVYAMSAVLLYALTGKRPPDAITRSREPRLNIPSELADAIPAHVITAIAGGLQVHGEDRTTSMDQLMSELFVRGSSEEFRAQPQPPRPVQPAQRSFSQRSADWARHMGQRMSGQNGGRPAANPNEPWYKNLSQLQYLLLSTCVGIIILGTISIIVFLNVRDLLPGGKKQSLPTVTYVDTVSDTDEEAPLTYEVPQFVGMKWADVSGNQDYVMFQILEMQEQYSDDYDVGEIMKQSIGRGEMVVYGTPIAITVSLGSEMCSVPNIIGMTIIQADTALMEAGLQLGEQTEEYNETVSSGLIIDLVGSSVGSRMKRGSMVQVRVSLGREG